MPLMTKVRSAAKPGKSIQILIRLNFCPQLALPLGGNLRRKKKEKRPERRPE